jgi:hypothetical protein
MWGTERGGVVGAWPAGRGAGCLKLAAFAKTVLDPNGGVCAKRTEGVRVLSPATTGAQTSNPPPGGEGLLCERRVTDFSVLPFVCGRKSACWWAFDPLRKPFMGANLPDLWGGVYLFVAFLL